MSTYLDQSLLMSTYLAPKLTYVIIKDAFLRKISYRWKIVIIVFSVLGSIPASENSTQLTGTVLFHFGIFTLISFLSLTLSISLSMHYTDVSSPNPIAPFSYLFLSLLTVTQLSPFLFPLDYKEIVISPFLRSSLSSLCLKIYPCVLFKSLWGQVQFHVIRVKNCYYLFSINGGSIPRWVENGSYSLIYMTVRSPVGSRTAPISLIYTNPFTIPLLFQPRAPLSSKRPPFAFNN
jgi:hypothetical protein